MVMFIIRIINEMRFNRYIVECKYRIEAGDFGNGRGFNRYIVECKYNLS